MEKINLIKAYKNALKNKKTEDFFNEYDIDYETQFLVFKNNELIGKFESHRLSEKFIFNHYLKETGKKAIFEKYTDWFLFLEKNGYEIITWLQLVSLLYNIWG